MNRTEIYAKLTEVFCDVFDDNELILRDDMTADDIDEWDSLTHISLIAAIEDTFEIRFDMKHVITLKNVGELVDVIEEMTKGN